jgi:hypothetical protein
VRELPFLIDTAPMLEIGALGLGDEVIEILRRTVLRPNVLDAIGETTVVEGPKDGVGPTEFVCVFFE